MPALLRFTTPAGHVHTTRAKDDPVGPVTLDLIEARKRGVVMIDGP